MLAILAAVCAGVIAAGEPAMQCDSNKSARYFRTFAGYSHPLALRQEVTQEQAKKGGAAYWCAIYDEAGRMTVVEKRHAGRHMSKFCYVYSSTGKLIEAFSTTPEGVRTRIPLKGNSADHVDRSVEQQGGVRSGV